MNGANVNCPKLLLTLGKKDITIDPAQLKINNTTVAGKVAKTVIPSISFFIYFILLLNVL